MLNEAANVQLKEYAMSDVLNVLIKARNLISSKYNWCTDAFSQVVVHNGRTYKAYCARGAIYEALGIESYNAYTNTDEPYCAELFKELPPPYNTFGKYGTRSRVAAYNNDSEHEGVVAIFDKTIARLKRDKVIKDLLTTKVEVPETNMLEEAGI
jgi:hypothetical protein